MKQFVAIIHEEVFLNYEPNAFRLLVIKHECRIMAIKLSLNSSAKVEEKSLLLTL